MTQAAAPARRLHAGFLASAAAHPHRTALEVDGEGWTYARLEARAGAIAATLRRRAPAGHAPRAAVFAHRSATGYAGILGALIAGYGYVPLNRTYPVARTRAMLRRSGAAAIIVDAHSESQIDAVLESSGGPMLVLCPDRDDVRELAARLPGHSVVGAADLEPRAAAAEVEVEPGGPAYLLFTSGSTGTPKGVLVSHLSASHFVETMTERYGVSADDRFSQMFDATFDLSVFDLFVAWRAGACVCCPPERAMLNPDRFIRDSRLTVWFSVPTAAALMKRFGALAPGRYPALRWSLFCGEPLPVDVARAWAAAAPGSTLENLYGPTEATVACTAYRWIDGAAGGFVQGTVPIGRALPGMTTMVAGERLEALPPGTAGELLVAGPQVAGGYHGDPDATAASFVVPPGRRQLFYRTGDRVREAHDGTLSYLGRFDHQVKVRGYRVELGEVEAALREVPGVEGAVAVPWPLSATGAAGIVAFLTGSGLEPVAIRSRVGETLQSHAVPHAIHVLSELPRNPNGKIDRGALQELLGR